MAFRKLGCEPALALSVMPKAWHSRLPARVMQPSGLRPSPTDAAAEKALDGAHWAPAPHRKPSVWIAANPNRGPQAASLQRPRDVRSVRDMPTAGVGEVLMFLWYKTGVPFDNPVRLPLGEGEKGA